jgi:hypothetical protein
MNRYAAYIDESGNHDLATEKSGASDYFLVLAVIIRQDDVAALEASVEKIRAKFFGPGEIKSSNVKDERRIRIINELQPLNFKFYAVAIEKSKVNKDSGLTHKKTFIKFTNGLLYKALFQHLIDLKVYADGHGDQKFIKSFEEYIEENHMPDLFTQKSSIEIVDSKDQILVQLADFLVGTAAKLYEGKATAEFEGKFLTFLREKQIRIDEWPPRFEVHHPVGAASNEMDTTVCSISLLAAIQFLGDQSSPDLDLETRIQHATLSYLLFRARFPTDDDFISTQEIVDHLHVHGFLDVTKHYLRSNVVSKLRDSNVVIASSTKGYKIPTSYSDLVGFAELVDGIISPLLSRLNRANGIFNLGSAGRVNILNEDRFNNIRLMLTHLDGGAK